MIMAVCLCILLVILDLNWRSIHAIESEPHLYMDNQTLCNAGRVDLIDVPTWRIYSHAQYHDKYLYFPDTHCSITIRTNKRVWMSVVYFRSNSSSTFPRCTEAKYAGNDDRLQIVDGHKTGAILRIICGKDTDQRFDRTPLILKSSMFTVDWQTKSQSQGFELKFVAYDLSTDGTCTNSSQFHCRNRRCIDRSFICSDEDYCGDNSHLHSAERREQCPARISKQKLIHWPSAFILLIGGCFLCTTMLLSVFVICRKRRKNKAYRVGL